MSGNEIGSGRPGGRERGTSVLIIPTSRGTSKVLAGSLAKRVSWTMVTFRVWFGLALYFIDQHHRCSRLKLDSCQSLHISRSSAPLSVAANFKFHRSASSGTFNIVGLNSSSTHEWVDISSMF